MLPDPFLARRLKMVAETIEARGVTEPQVLKAMREVPRHLFVPSELIESAYEDRPLDIGRDQTISQPYVVALMAQAAALKPTDRVLEVGTGSGYGAAVVSRIAREVYSIERHEELAKQARGRLAGLGYTNVQVEIGDGTLGLAAHAPYQAVLVTAGGRALPEPLLWQLDTGGRLVIPIGDERGQKLMRVAVLPDGSFAKESLLDVRFVPLVGKNA